MVHENVKGYNWRELEDLLGAKYIIFSVVVSLACLGYPNARDRRISLCVHRSLACTVRIPWSLNFTATFHRECHISFKDFMLASPEELAQEFAWASKRKSDTGLVCDDETEVFEIIIVNDISVHCNSGS